MPDQQHVQDHTLEELSAHEFRRPGWWAGALMPRCREEPLFFLKTSQADAL